MNRKTVEIPNPAPVYASRHIACERRVRVPVRANDRAGFHQRHDVALHSIGEIGRVDQAEGGRGEHLLLLPPAGGLSHERRGIPLAKGHGIPLRSEPVREQRKLSGFSGAVYTFHHDQFAAVAVRNEDCHWRARPHCTRGYHYRTVTAASGFATPGLSMVSVCPSVPDCGTYNIRGNTKCYERLDS